MHDQVKATELEWIDSRGAELPEPGPAVVELPRPCRQAEAGEVERDTSQASPGQLGDHLSVQEGGCRHPVHAQDGLTVSLLANEATNPGRLKLASGGAMLGHDIATPHKDHPTC